MHSYLAQTASVQEIPTKQLSIESDNTILGLSPNVLFLVLSCSALLIIVILGNIFSGNRKNVLGTGKWANQKHKSFARKRSHQQLKSKRHDEVTLWINSPKISEESKITADKNTVWLPDAARGTSIIGGAGSGKSFTVTIPTLRSAIAQGLSTMLLDTDYPGLTKTIAPLAEDLGYEVSIFAPGYKESAVCNVVDLIYNCRDATGASQVAKTLVKNFQMAATDASSTDAFFGPAGELATEAALLLAKALKYPDILTAYTILKDEDMISRVRGVSKIDPWLDLAFGQLLSTAKSERTVDSIRGTAALLFGQLMRPDILPSLVGKTTIPLDITGRKLIIFGVKQNIRLVVSPLIASVINALVSRNVLHGRKEPLFLSLDEMPSMYFPEIAEWLSEKRKYGLCTQIGYQSLGQLRKTYGKDQADVIYTNTATKFFFNPQSLESAKTFSETLGEQDVVYKTKNRTYGRPRTRTEHRTKKRLMTPDEFMNQAEGCCVLLSPGYGTKTERFIPVRFQPLKIADSELEIQKMVEESWETFLSEKERTGIGNKQVAPDEISKRIDDFQNRLPIIKSKTNASPLDMMLQDV